MKYNIANKMMVIFLEIWEWY